jgi:hypothetical protein
MQLPVIRGRIERRLLVNFRVEPDAIRRILPSPFEPQLVSGHAIAGICLIRLSGIRPALVPDAVPAAFGLRSENAAHRIAVEWTDAKGIRRTGVYIPRRDSTSRLNRWLGGRVFPGVHHAARFTVEEREGRYAVALRSSDGQTRVAVEGEIAARMPAGSVFRTVAEASAFFEQGALGYSATARPGVFDGLELRSFAWRVEPLEVSRVASSFFEDSTRFPLGAVAFDSALLMRDIRHEWHAREPLCCSPAPAAA